MRNRFGLALAFMTTLTVGAMAVGCGEDNPNVNPTGGTGAQGGGTTASSSSSGGGDGGGGSGGGAVACPSNEGITMAVKSLVFGEGVSGEWKKVGYNLDDKISTANSKDLCGVNSNAMTSIPYPDGDEGIDNSFGKNLLPTILSLYPTWVTDINNGIQNGRFTALVKMMCVPPTGDVPQFTTKLFGGTALAAPPKYDGTDKWPVEPGLLNDVMDPQSASIQFFNSSITSNVYDAGKGATFIISVPIKTAMESTSIKLTLYNARITMTLSEDRKSATGGMIGGVVNTEEFVAEVKKVGALLGLCGTPLFDNLLTLVRQSSDMMVEGAHDPAVPCDGISAGLGFEMAPAEIGEVGPANPVGMACP